MQDIIQKIFSVIRSDMFPVRRITRRNQLKNLEKSMQNVFTQINVTIRREMGADINAACGQLRKSHLNNNKTL